MKKGGLNYACDVGDLDLVRKLLQDDNIDVHETSDGDTPLHVSILRENAEIVKMLMQDKRVNVNKWNETGDCPLYTAIGMDNIRAPA
jgi:ankyrin repeat protein